MEVNVKIYALSTLNQTLLTSGRVILQTQIDVLGDTETKASSTGEVLLLQLVLLYLEATVKNLVGLETANL